MRYKGSATKVIVALEHLYLEGLNYVSDCGLIDAFGGLDCLCSSCGCYNRSISFLTRHVDDTVNIYLQSSSKRRWRIGGCPETLAVFASRQGLQSPFGRDDHGHPCRKPCEGCDAVGATKRGKRRRRESRGSVQEAPKRTRALWS